MFISVQLARRRYRSTPGDTFFRGGRYRTDTGDTFCDGGRYRGNTGDTFLHDGRYRGNTGDTFRHRGRDCEDLGDTFLACLVQELADFWQLRVAGCEVLAMWWREYAEKHQKT